MNESLAKACVWAGMAVIAVAMVVGPMLAPPEFSVLRHSTSEQAGQQMPGAWIMRAGFLAYGCGVLLASLIGWRRRPWVRSALCGFGAGMVAAAIWSNLPVVPGWSGDVFEDWLHSVASGAVGTAFALACALAIFGPEGRRNDVLAWFGLGIAVLIPVLMAAMPEVRGLLQRGMFVFSFVFVAREFGRGHWRTRRSAGSLHHN